MEEWEAMGEFIDEETGVTSENDAWKSECEIEEERWNEVIKKAEAGDAKAQYKLGRGYAEDRWMLPKDLAKAVIWLRKAAEQGHDGARKELDKLQSKPPLP